MSTLRNPYLTARFSETGQLIHLSPNGRGAGLVRGCGQRYLDLDRNQWHSSGAAKKGGEDKSIETLSVEVDETAVTSLQRSEHLDITTRYELPENSPLLSICVQVEGRGSEARLGHCALPHLAFSPSFNDAFEDEEDLYFDGAELGGGYELPCWRVFFRKGHEDGLMLATRSKRDMARFTILERAVDLEPHGTSNYTSNPIGARPPLIATAGVLHEAKFEIGPWQKAQHRALLRRAELSKPVCAGHAAAKGKPKANLKGEVFYALDFADVSATSNEYSPRRWMLAPMPWAQKGKALVAGSGVRPPALHLDPKLGGVYRIFAGVANGDGIALRLSGDPETTIRLASLETVGDTFSPAFKLHLSGTHKPHEIECGVARLDGKTFRIERFPNLLGTTVLDYMRFEPLSVAQARAWETSTRKQPGIELSGFVDVPDIAPFTDVRDPNPAAYRANIWEHARCGFKKLYWRIDGQCSDFPAKHNTMRYISAKVHSVFCPSAKAYGRVLKKVDMLELAVKAAEKYGVELYGWMRFNSYIGNVQSDFYKSHPQFWEEHENGHRGGKLCLAIPEVRAHKIAILVEAASYGLQGLNLGFLRHPPILMFHPVLVESYRKKYGKLPPRDAKRPDPQFINTLPPSDPEHTRWYQHRADVMTIFGRELKAALRSRGLEHVKISIWVRPNHCLFDGIDLPMWLSEGLCDEVVCNGMIGPERCYREDYDPEVCGVRPAWKNLVQARASLERCLAYGPLSRWKRHLPEVLSEGYEGLCTYESDWSVLDPGFVEFYRSLRR
jgi:hypothetical protein